MKSSLGGQNIYYKKHVSKRWDPRPGIFDTTIDPIQRFHLRVGTQEVRLGTLNMRSET